jgi:hypothetical protein
MKLLNAPGLKGGQRVRFYCRPRRPPIDYAAPVRPSYTDQDHCPIEGMPAPDAEMKSWSYGEECRSISMVPS